MSNAEFVRSKRLRCCLGIAICVGVLSQPGCDGGVATMPLVVAGVGGVGSWFFARAQYYEAEAHKLDIELKRNELGRSPSRR